MLRLAMAITAIGPCAEVAIAQVIEPAASGNDAASTAGASQRQDQIVRAYAVTPPSSIDQVAQQLAQRFPPSTGVRISPDTRTSQILVVAPPAIQQQIAALMPAMNNPAASNPPDSKSGLPQSEAQRGPRVVPLLHLTWREFETALGSIFGKPLPVTVEHGGDWARYVLETRGGRVNLIVDRKAGQVALEGPVKLADAWAQIVQSLDNHPPQPNDDTRLVRLNVAKTNDVLKALSALPGNTTTTVGSPRTATGGASTGQNADNGGAGRFINMIFQPPADGDQSGSSAAQPAQTPSSQLAQVPPQQVPPAGTNPDQPDQNQPQQPAQPAPTGADLIGPVQIEFLEGLDAIVVRGNPRDVERVMQIINEIEQLSAVTQPRIEIYPLRFVSGQTLYNLVQSIYDQTLATRQGRVSITPLVKPNSLLLIGRDEAVQSVIDLIKRLDQPVNPASLFQVFPIKHASATAAQQTVNQFFATRGGLGGNALVVADFRSNSLIVQASPRDLQEVDALLKKIDVPSSSAVNELRIFPLKNSVAEELATVLQNAISIQGQQNARGQQNGQQQQQGAAGAAPGGAGFGNGFGGAGFGGAGFGGAGAPGGFGGAGAAPGGFGGGGAAGGAQNAQTQQQQQLANQVRSTMLRFVTIDGDLKQGFHSGILSDVHITADSRANTLLVSAPSESMELIAALIRQLDQMPSAESQIKVFEIKNGDAVNLIQMLETLFGQTVRTGGGGGGGAGGANSLIQGGAVEVENVLVPVRFSADERTNSIIASGSTNDLAVVEAILLRLDESDIRLRKTTIYRLKNVYAPNVATSITQFLTQQRTLNQQFQQQGATNPFSEMDQEVIVVAEPTSNSLIISATPRYYDEIMKIVEQIDRRPPMVMIQVLIAQVTLDNTDEFGVEMGLQDSVLFDRSLIGSPTFVTRAITTSNPATGIQTTTDVIVGADNIPGFNFNSALPLGSSGSDSALANPGAVGGQGITNLGLGRSNSTLGYGGLVLSASSDSVSALLRALSECRRVDVLSRPQIMTLDNQPAFLQVGQQVPRVTSSSVTATGTINTVTLDNVGIILNVQPRVSPDNLIVMQVDAEKSDLGPEDQGIPISISTSGQVIRSPFYNTTLAQTTVQAVEGQTIVLAGLITSNKSQDHRRVPYLSNIPLLGNLFRYDLVTQERTELLIVLTPHVVRNEDDADRIKQAEAARMSWCLGDIIKINGPSGLRSRKDDFADSETNVVYPDIHPDGSPVGADLPKNFGEELPAPKVAPPIPKPPASQPTPAKNTPDQPVSN